jgi:putative redox protein
MKTSVKWTDGVSFLGKSESGHSVSLDGPSELGGKNSGMRPMEMMLISIGGCTSFDVVTILKKSRQNITDCVAEISSERAEGIPKVFKKIHIHFIVSGEGLDKTVVERAIKLSSEKYCSASIMLKESIDFYYYCEIFK